MLSTLTDVLLLDYQAQSDRGSRTLIVSETDPNMPIALMTRSAETFHDMRFMSFSGTAPPSSAFEVPTECRPPPHKRHH